VLFVARTAHLGPETQLKDDLFPAARKISGTFRCGVPTTSTRKVSSGRTWLSVRD